MIEDNAMTNILRSSLSRRGLIAGASGSALLAAAGRTPVHAQAVAPAPAAAGNAAAAGGQSAVIDVNRARAAPIPIAIPDLVGPDGASAQFGRTSPR